MVLGSIPAALTGRRGLGYSLRADPSCSIFDAIFDLKLFILNCRSAFENLSSWGFGVLSLCELSLFNKNVFLVTQRYD